MKINFHQVKKFLNHALRANRKGHGIHSPFAYTLCEEVFYNEDSFYDFTLLAEIRHLLENNHDKLEYSEFGAGSKKFTGGQRKVSEIARHGISKARQSQILYKLINFMQYKTNIELGTSLGLNALYIAKAAPQAKNISIEGNHSLVDFAAKLALVNQQNNIRFIEGTFDEKFPLVLKEINTLDFLYVDGNHNKDATLRYFEMALHKKNNKSVFVFDDIYWSPGMTDAWDIIKKHPSVTLSIDCFYFGLVFFREEIKEKVEHRFWI